MLIMLNEKNSWGHPTCKNIHTYINIVCLNIYKISMPTQFFFFQCIEEDSFFSQCGLLPIYLSTTQTEGLLKMQILGFHPWPTELETLESQPKDFCLPTHPCPPTYYLVRLHTTLTDTDSHLHLNTTEREVVALRVVELWVIIFFLESLKKIIYQVYAAFYNKISLEVY